MTTADLLRAARALYAANPSHAALGEVVAPGTRCAIGAICLAETRNPFPGVFAYAVSSLRDAVPFGASLVDFNAEHSTAEVLALFDRAIAKAEAA